MQEFTSAESEFDVDYLTCALRVAESLHGDAYLEVAEAIAFQYVEAGQLDRSVELAEHLPDAYARDSILAAIAAKAVASEREDYATELLETIEEPVLYNSALEAMSIEFARRGKFDEALSLTDQLSDNDSALAAIATMYWQSGLKNEAVDLARSLEFAQQSAMTLAQLARLSDQKDESSNLLVEAQQVAEQIDSAELKVAALIAIASGYEAHADREQALGTLNRAFEACEEYESASVIGLSGAFPKDEALLQILDGLLRLQDHSKATDVVEAIEDRFLFSQGDLKLAVAQGQDGRPGEAAKHLDETMDTILELEAYSRQEVEVRDALIIELAIAYANLSDYAKARRVIHSVTSEEKQGLALKELGKVSARANYDRGVFEIEEDLRSLYDKAQYWLGIYDATNSNNPELSERAMSRALENAESLEQPVDKAEALTGIAFRFAKSQNATKAESFFLAATNAATLIEGTFLKARALLRLGRVSREIGRKPSENEQRLLEQCM